MRGFSKVVVAGNLTRDPEMRSTTNGNSVCNLGIAVSRQYRGSDGQNKEEVSFFNCSAWGGTGETLAKFLHKGDPVLLSGRLRQRSWDDQKTGEKRSAVEINVDDFCFIGRGDGTGTQNTTGGNRTYNSGISQEVVPDDVPDTEIDINDVPF